MHHAFHLLHTKITQVIGAARATSVYNKIVRHSIFNLPLRAIEYILVQLKEICEKDIFQK